MTELLTPAATLRLADLQLENFNISSFRDSDVQRAYLEKRLKKLEENNTDCDLCDRPNKKNIDRGLLEIIEKDFSLFPNDFPYMHYDGFKVKPGGHDLLVPKEHVSDYRELSADARSAYGEAMIYISATGLYSVVAKRSHFSPGSSIPDHGHDHLYDLDETAKVIQQIHCDECRVVHTAFKGEPHIAHNRPE